MILFALWMIVLASLSEERQLCIFFTLVALAAVVSLIITPDVVR